MADKRFRCAVYTRKSTEDGLEQEFNSLHAQYEACASYAVSQRHEGWVLLEERYDDGGFSGGNMERPGLKRLLADVAASRIDIVLLYKIDRLTRSLTDFAKIVEVLDKAGASFVSITQSFNTTTSMGRLTLNMLLSFAQFEREVTAERIRDKIAASKRKGIWMGGPVPLGYEVRERKLVVNETEAETVRHIMRRYLELGTVPALVEELEREDYRTKVRTRRDGSQVGGTHFGRGMLYNLLSNRIYRGCMVHKGKAWPGEHEAIVDEDLFEAVQLKLTDNTNGSSRRLGHEHPSLLTGKLVDGAGRPMGPSHATKRSKRYRYYVTRSDLSGSSPPWRVSAHDLEELVCFALAERFLEPQLALDLAGSAASDAQQLQHASTIAARLAQTLRGGSAHARVDLLAHLLEQVRLHEDRAELAIDEHALHERLGLDLNPATDKRPIVLTIPSVRVRRGKQVRLIVPGAKSKGARPARYDDKLIELMGEAHAARMLVLSNSEQPISRIARDHSRCRTRLRKLVVLSCLAPDIVASILEGQQPEHLGAAELLNARLPHSWAEQRRVLGFS